MVEQEGTTQLGRTQEGRACSPQRSRVSSYPSAHDIVCLGQRSRLIHVALAKDDLTILFTPCLIPRGDHLDCEGVPESGRRPESVDQFDEVLYLLDKVHTWVIVRMKTGVRLMLVSRDSPPRSERGGSGKARPERVRRCALQSHTYHDAVKSMMTSLSLPALAKAPSRSLC